MDLDPAFLSRLQFAWVIGWHILLPAITVGLAAYIAMLEGLNFFTGKDIYLRISTFWIKIFSIAFGMGVVTGVVMPFQFGTNWSRFSDATANVLSPLFAYEDLAHRTSPSRSSTAPARTGAPGRPPSISTSISAAIAGPLRTIRSMRKRPAG